MTNVDWNVGRLLAAVDWLGLSNNTILVFTSDHGELFGAHGRRAKNIFYDEAVHVPFLICWPGWIAAGGITEVCLNSPDLAPTLLRPLGLPFTGKWREWTSAHVFKASPAKSLKRRCCRAWGCTAEWIDGHEWRGLRSRRFTYAVYRVDGQECFFDNLADPYQQRNLVGCVGRSSILWTITGPCFRAGWRHSTIRSRRAPGIAITGRRTASSFALQLCRADARIMVNRGKN